MTKIYYQGKVFYIQSTESVLTALLRQGVEIPFSCQAGICKICLMHADTGIPPKQANRSLQEDLRQQNFFLACQCFPQEVMHISTPQQNSSFLIPVTLQNKQALNPSILSVQLHSEQPLNARAGQYIHLVNANGLTRTYSIAQLQDKAHRIELHLKLWPEGKMGHWLQQAPIGERLKIYPAQGTCFYQTETMKDSPLLMIATGTGLAPLWGVLQDALRAKHNAPIYLYHGSQNSEGLYLHSLLQALTKKHTNLSYIPCLSQDSQPNIHVGRALEKALQDHHGHLHEMTLFMCGHPEMIDDMSTYLQNKKIEPQQFLIDKFSSAGAPPSPDFKHKAETHTFPDPDPEMWEALGKGALLAQILQDFYDKVYGDEQLAPFFTVTKAHAIGKQFAFLNQAFSGDNVYFGEHPRNAHHWMVISDELFDYREALMEASLRKFKLPEHLITRWLQLDNTYRNQMVKKEPWPKIIFGQELPLGGYERIRLEDGGSCDGCHAIIENGEEVSYHLRLANIYCPTCLPKTARTSSPSD